MRRRVLAPELWTDGKVVRLGSDLGTLIWIALIAQSDDEGLVDLDPVAIQVAAHITAPIQEIEKLLAKIIELRLVVPYTVDGQTFGFLPGFFKHQSLDRPCPTKHPRPPTELLAGHPVYVQARRDTFNRPACRHRGLFGADESKTSQRHVVDESQTSRSRVSDESAMSRSEPKRSEAKRSELNRSEENQSVSPYQGRDSRTGKAKAKREPRIGSD